ncbi:MAG: hypothetical protein U0263_08585 [Polyangiaceae bacterium]
MDDRSKPASNIWLAAPGVIACLGIVWLGVRLSSMESRLSAPSPMPPTSVESPPPSAATAGAGPATPTTPPVAPKPAELDATAIVKYWNEAASARVMAHCKSGGAASAIRSVELTLLVDATGAVVDARAEPTERAKDSALYDCVTASLRTLQLPAPGKLVQGKVSLPVAAK